MGTYNLSAYNANGSTKSLSQQLSDVGTYVSSISSSMKSIQATASTFKGLLSTTSTQTSTTIPNLLKSLNQLSGLNGSIKSFLSNWTNNQALLNSDLSNLSSWVTGNWSSYVSTLNQSLNSVTSILGNVESASTSITNTVTGSVSSTITQYVSSGVATISADQTLISTTINKWSNYYTLLTLGCIGNTSSTQGLPVPASTTSQELNNTTQPMTSTTVSINGYSYTYMDIQNYVNVLTSLDPSSMTSSNYTSYYNLSAQFAAWSAYILPALDNEISVIKTDISNYNSGVSGSLDILNVEVYAFKQYVSMLVQLTGYWNNLLTQAVSYINAIKATLKSVSSDVNKLTSELTMIVNVLKGTSSSSANQLGAQLETTNQNLKSYSAQLQALSLVSSGSGSDNNIWLGVGILAGLAGLFLLLFKNRH